MTPLFYRCSARTTQKTASSIVACWTVFTELLLATSWSNLLQYVIVLANTIRAEVQEGPTDHALCVTLPTVWRTRRFGNGFCGRLSSYSQVVILCVVTLCSLLREYQHFRGTSCLYLQGRSRPEFEFTKKVSIHPQDYKVSQQRKFQLNNRVNILTLYYLPYF
jgi:hypothetical protein